MTVSEIPSSAAINEEFNTKIDIGYLESSDSLLTRYRLNISMGLLINP
jgi:hypothetical protein